MELSKSIGIVGGVGPYAGLDLNKKIFDNIITQGRDQDYPEVFLLSRSSDIADRTQFLNREVEENPAEGLFRSILKLDQLDTFVAAIPCNTAHSPKIFNHLESLMSSAGVRLKLLNIIEETYAFIKTQFPLFSTIGLLGTLGTYQTQVYESYFLDKNEFHLILPHPEGRQNCHNAIYDKSFGVKAVSNPVTQEAKTIFEQEIDQMAAQGVQAVIMGCTEIPLAFENQQRHREVVLIDPTLILARALIREIDITRLKTL